MRCNPGLLTRNSSDGAHVAGDSRFFCGPNAKKSAALAKQQKKRPAAGKQSKDTVLSDLEEAEGEPSEGKASGSKKPAKGKTSAGEGA